MSAEAEAPAEQRKKRPAAKQTGTAIIHSLWDERDEDYAPVDHATYSGNIWNLFEVSYIADGKENTFSYDARGNRLSEIETYTGSNGRVTDYEYYENSDLIKKAGNWYFNYDKNGNLLARGTITTISTGKDFSAWTFSETEGELWTYEYDLQNRMTKASYSGKGSANLRERGSYVYDYRGLLVKKTYQNYNPSDLVEVVNDEASKTVTEFYEYTANGRVIYNERSEDNKTKKTTYIWANTTLWCEINEGVVYYHHTDHLGTTEVVTDENGTVVWEAGYEAFGSVLSERGDSSFCPSYTGKFFDKASGLYYFNARWYDSELGKFTTSDPIRDGVNWWNYCSSNPLLFFDFNGLEDISIKEINKAYWRGVKDGFVGIGKNAWNTVRHPIQTAKEDFNRIAHPIKTTKATIQSIKDYSNSDIYTQVYTIGKLVPAAVLRQAGAEAIGAYNGLSSGRVGKSIGPKQLALPAPEGKMALPAPASVPLLPSPETLYLPPPTGKNPWMEGTTIISMLAPKDFVINMAMAPGQKNPGNWGTLENIPNVNFARNNLAITPEFKQEIDNVQKFLVPEGERIQFGIVGPQIYNGEFFPGGATQIQVFDRSVLKPVGEPIKIR